MHEIPWWRTSFSDEEVKRLGESVAQEHISQGPVTEQFEFELAASLDVPYAVATTSGSVALLLALMALGVGPGDEVIVPDRTWIATAHAAMLAGAKVVLVDVRPDVPTMDTSQIEQMITPRTKAIMPVYMNGRGDDEEEILRVARKHGLLVIEDACQALFSKSAAGYLGTHSDAGCFSLGVGKLISTGQGGVVVTRSEKTYETLKLVRNHGVVDNFTDVWSQFGFNFKFTDLLASFGVVQLGRVPSRVAHVGQVYQKYARAIFESEFSFLRLIPVNLAGGEVPLYVEALCSERELLVEFLGLRGIQTRPFPPSLHTSAYLDSKDAFPRSDVFARQGMYLPCGPEQPLDNVDRVLEQLYLYSQQRET